MMILQKLMQFGNRELCIKSLKDNMCKKMKAIEIHSDPATVKMSFPWKSSPKKEQAFKSKSNGLSC